MNIGAVRQAIASALAPIPGVQINPYALANPTPPGIQILPPSVAYDFAMSGGVDEWTFVIQGFVSLSSDIGTQKKLDALCAPTGATSVKTLLEADKTLGGRVHALRVVSQDPGKVVERGGGNPMLLVEWRVQIFANGG
jgi:hypothetical protein